MNPQTLAEKLNAAADVIEERGHCHGTLQDSQGRVCVMGAARAVTLGNAESHWLDVNTPNRVAYLDLEAAISDAVDGSIGGWNDELRNGRFIHGKREAVNLLRSTAVKVLAGASA